MQSLSETDREAILAAARLALRSAVVRTGERAEFPFDGIFSEPVNLFVTLHTRGKLRGCIGVIHSRQSLDENLRHCTISAATEDPRFPSLKSEDVAETAIEVSLLSPMEEIRPDQVEIGKHGLLVEGAGRHGLLLPQVATEHKLSREQFLEETCLKAGLPRNAWKDPSTRILGFTCEVITETI